MSAEREENTVKRKAGRGSRRFRFKATLQAAGGRVILRLPDAKSEKLPSRGQVAVRGAINGYPFETVLEPDGDFGHWMNVDARLQEAAGAGPGAPPYLGVAS